LSGIGFDGSVRLGLLHLQQSDAESLRLALQASMAVLEQWMPRGTPRVQAMKK
jgi:hypothetical protein